MALRKEITKEAYGIQVVIKDVEFKVMSIIGDKNKIIMNLQGKINTQEEPIDVKNYSFIPDLNGNNFIAQAYEYLKTLEEFKDAEDC